jgi:hypothetical protein
VIGNVAYLARWNSGLEIVDVTNPAEPVLLGNLGLTYAQDVYVSGTTAFVANGWSGVAMVDASIPASPILVDSYNTPGDTASVSGNVNQVFAADGDGGVVVFQFQTLVLDIKMFLPIITR